MEKVKINRERTPYPKRRIALDEHWACECGKTYRVTAYVAAHWRVPLTHVCIECNRKHDLWLGSLVYRGHKKEDLIRRPSVYLRHDTGLTKRRQDDGRK